jgi:hypothetical protein
MWSWHTVWVVPVSEVTPFDVSWLVPMPLILRAHGIEHVGQVLHMRLAGGVADDGVALAHHGGHQDVLGAGDRGLVKEQVGAVSGRWAPKS